MPHNPISMASKLLLLLTVKAHMKDIPQKLWALRGLETGMEAFQEDAHDRVALSSTTSIRKQLPAMVLSIYDAMRSRGKPGVVEVKQGECNGCHFRLGPGDLATLGRGELRRCANCGRYLYLPEVRREASKPSLEPIISAKARAWAVALKV
jgi:predicted  nucleic acid-binding Zn-ribbon protein